jgi:hypothetical protein
MTDIRTSQYTAFDGYRLLASGTLDTVALAVKHAQAGGTAGPLLIFDDSTGRPIDVDLRGSDDAIRSRLAEPSTSATSGSTATAEVDASDGAAGEPRGRGRPKLGVVAREVTLLPRHWDWLASQPGGASVALRKLVEDARRTRQREDAQRQAQSSAYHFMSAIAGDMPGFEEATRALFAGERARMTALVDAWPVDVRDHALKLAFGSGEAAEASAQH